MKYELAHPYRKNSSREECSLFKYDIVNTVAGGYHDLQKGVVAVIGHYGVSDSLLDVFSRSEDYNQSRTAPQTNDTQEVTNE